VEFKFRSVYFRDVTPASGEKEETYVPVSRRKSFKSRQMQRSRPRYDIVASVHFEGRLLLLLHGPELKRPS
jgi:hypothetical protein